MRHLLIFMVKLARDANYSDKKLADILQQAADEVRKGGYWPSEIDRNSLIYQNSRQK